MAVKVEYITYNETIQSAKIPIDKDIYQVITSTIKKLETNGKNCD
ncbi:hypothetical protein [Lysinibacillus fusiformis]|nr:hypothetical protein [Lysinibacillus fusiformis]